MKKLNFIKIFGALLILWIILFTTDKSAIAAGLTTLYAGGEGASDSNDGSSSTAPLATLSHAADLIRSKGAGDYEIIVQGNIIETAEAVFGDDVNTYNITIKNVSDSEYTISGAVSPTLITVCSQTRLNLGNEYGEELINLILDGSTSGTIINGICNNGTLYLYNGIGIREINSYERLIVNRGYLRVSGGVISNNSSVFSAIYNLADFDMYGGTIANNTSNQSGTIYNGSNFTLHGGEIRNNVAINNFGGGVYNHGIFHMSGGSINGNRSPLYNGNGVYNGGLFIMQGGRIENNFGQNQGAMVYNTGTFLLVNGDICNAPGTIGGVYSAGTFNMTGGNITSNGNYGVNAINDFTMTGGRIYSNYSTGIIVTSCLTLGVGATVDTVSLDNTVAYIQLTSALNPLCTPIVSGPTDMKDIMGNKLLRGDDSYIGSSYKNVTLSDTNYSLNGDGRVISSNTPAIYYVGGTGASDTNAGLDDLVPFATLKKAIQTIAGDIGTIVLQSDVVIAEPMIIKGNITIKTDDSVRTIYRSPAFSVISYDGKDIWSMFIISGKLILGDSLKTDNANGLMINAFRGIDQTGYGDTVYIKSGGELSLYDGATIEDNLFDPAVHNEGTFNMHGGAINNNLGEFTGGIYNCQSGVFQMSGGIIEMNEASGGTLGGMIYSGGGVYNTEHSLFIMTGGEISGNTGITSGGVYVGTGCTFDMAGGKLQNNSSADCAKEVFIDTGAYFKLETGAGILNTNQVWLISGSMVALGGELTYDLEVTPVVYDSSAKKYNIRYIPGTQVLTGAGAYTISAQDIAAVNLNTSEFTISSEGKIAKILSAGMVSLPAGDSYTYTGSAITPSVLVKDGITTLVQGSDYTLTYDNNVNSGTAKLTVVGIGNYGGTVEKTYTVNRKVISAGMVSLPAGDSYTYTGSAITPSVLVKDGMTTLVQGLDYTLTYDNNLNSGTAKLTVTGIGNYGGTVDKTFTVKMPVYDPVIPPAPGGYQESADEDDPVDPTDDDRKVTVIISQGEAGRSTSHEVSYDEIILEEELLQSAKDNGKDLIIKVADEEGKEQYSWSFAGRALVKSDKKLGDINLSLSVSSINHTRLEELLQGNNESGSNDREAMKGLIIHFGHHGDLPAMASVRIYVGNQEGIKPGDKLYLYYFNSDTEELDSLPNSFSYTVDADGYVTIEIVHCSDYVLLKDQPEDSTVISLMDQIEVNLPSGLLYYGGTTGKTIDYRISLPSTLVWLEDGEKSENGAVGAVYITFSSGNPEIASVDSKGHIIAKSIGKTTVSAEVKLYNGVIKTFKKTITVKEAYMKLTKKKTSLKLGESFTYTVAVYGFKKSDVTWVTTKKSIVKINKVTGKAKAASTGIDYIAVKAGNKSLKIKVTVIRH